MMQKYFGIGTLALLLVVGCGPTASVHVTGSVTRDGVPLTGGSVQFEPDSSAGNKGTGMSCPIIDGKFETPADRGPAVGANIVRVNPPELESGSEFDPATQFKPYETTANITEGANVIDLVVPSSTE